MTARAAMVLAAGMLAGCSSLGVVPVPHHAQTTGAAALEFLDRLTTASVVELQQMDARHSAGPAQPSAALRHGLWLAVPGHPGHDPAAAHRRLEALLADRPDLDASTRALIRLQLRHLRARNDWLANNRRLAAENERLREQIQALTVLERRMNGAPGASGETSP